MPLHTTDVALAVVGGVDDTGAIEVEVEEAELYLLLISSAFIDSNYCMEKEFARALERHRSTFAARRYTSMKGRWNE